MRPGMSTLLIAIAVGLSSAVFALLGGPGGAPAQVGVSGPVLPATLPASAPALKVPILMYHLVDFSPPPAGRWAAGLTVSTADFTAQMEYLARNGFQTVTLEDIYTAMAGGRALPPKPVAITFDDGYMDNYSVAFPILQAHGFVATFFVITGYVGNQACVTWEDLRAMQADGMAIESHTVDHKDLRSVDPQQLKAELAGSRETIAFHLGRTPLVLCYPSGKYDGKVIDAVQAAGYLMAVTTRPGTQLDPVSRYEWPRVRVSPGTSLQGFILSVS